MRSPRSWLRTLEEDIVGPDNRQLFCAWCGAVIVVVLLGFYFSSDSVSILGVADSRELQVNFDRPVAIKQIHVIPGQNVTKGDLLLELNQSDLEMQLSVLRGRSDKLAAELRLRDQISSLAENSEPLAAGADPLKTEWRDVQREIDLVEERLRNLFVFAEMNGRVGGVNFKVGEKVPAFSPILTLLPLNPTSVNGYINENLHSQIKIGQMVEVISVSGATVQGHVTSLGSRIVPIPARLLRIPSLPAWGREIVVEIPPKNSLLVGEKVSVHRVWQNSLFKVAQADEAPPLENSTVADPEKIEFPEDLTGKFQPEISGMVFIPELKQFVLVSDDYPKKRPFIMLMTDQGEVQNRMPPLEGLGEMADIESVTYQDGNLYLLSSLSPTKKGKFKKNRQIFAKALRKDMRFVLEAQVDFRAALIKALEASPESLFQEILAAPDEIEIEGHALKNKDLYIALKNPVGIAREHIILKLKDFDQVFENGYFRAEDLSVAKRFQLRLPDKDIQVLVTDMIFFNDQIYLASSLRGKVGSAIWRIDEMTGAVNLLQEFTRKHLEALAVLPRACQLYGIFESSEGNYLTRLPVLGVKKESRCF